MQALAGTIITFFCSAQVLFVQAADRLDMMTIEVTAPRIERHLPLAVTTVSADQAPAANRQSLQDLLEPVPGVFALNQDNAAQGLRLSIRGFGSRAAFGVRGLQVLLDGIPLTLPDGQTELDALDLDQIGKLRVIRGPSATLFGNAAGGVVLLESHMPDEDDSLDLNMQVSRFGGRRFRISGGTDGLLSALLINRQDGFRQHARTESELLNVSWKPPLEDGSLSLHFSALDITAEDPGGLTRAQADGDLRAAHPRNLQFKAGEGIQQQRAAMRWQGYLGEWSMGATAYGGRRAFENRLPFQSGGQVRFLRHFGGAGLQASRVLAGHQASLGLDWQVQRDDRQRFDNNNGIRGQRTLDQMESARGVGIFLRDTFRIAPDWEVSLGVRHDRLQLKVEDAFPSDGDDSGSRQVPDWSADASLAHWIGNHYAYARLASSFETPTINELANPAGGGFNPSLSSAQALNRELGVRGELPGGHYSATLYRIDVRDELLPFQLPTQPGRTFYRNAGTTRRSGLEMTGAWNVATHWRLDGSLNLARYRFQGGNLAGNQLPGLPERSLRLAIHYQRGSLKSALIGRYVGRLFADDANTTEVSGYYLLDLQTEWRAGAQAAVRLGIDNLLDRHYFDNVRINAFGGRHFEPAAGRSYRLSVHFSL